MPHSARSAISIPFGRPLLVVPFAHDQPDNAFRAKNLGVARSIHYLSYNARRAEHALAALNRDASYVTRAQEIAEIIRAEDGISTACDAIESVLAA